MFEEKGRAKKFPTLLKKVREKHSNNKNRTIERELSIGMP